MKTIGGHIQAEFYLSEGVPGVVNDYERVRSDLERETHRIGSVGWYYLPAHAVDEYWIGVRYSSNTTRCFANAELTVQ